MSRFTITKSVRDKAVDTCFAILNDPTAKLKDKTDAVKSLAALDKLNVEEDKIHAPQLILHADLNKMTEEQLHRKLQELETQLQQVKQIEEITAVEERIQAKDGTEIISKK